MKTLFALLLTFTLLSCKSQQQSQFIITKSCLAELISSDDEIECFAYYFDITPNIIKANVNHYRVLYSTELLDAGWNPTNLNNLINYRVPFDNYGNIVSWDKFKDLYYVIKDDKYHRVYHYPVDEEN